MSIAGTALAVGALAKGALAVGLVASDVAAADYFEGTDILGAESDYPTKVRPLLDSRQYWTSVAAGLTVACIIGIGGAFIVKKGRRS